AEPVNLNLLPGGVSDGHASEERPRRWREEEIENWQASQRPASPQKRPATQRHSSRFPRCPPCRLPRPAPPKLFSEPAFSESRLPKPLQPSRPVAQPGRCQPLCPPHFQLAAPEASRLSSSMSSSSVWPASAAPLAPFSAGVVTTACPAGLSGTEGRRCARMSAARTRGVVASATACCSCFPVTTRTSSRRLRSAAGLIWIFRNISRPGLTLLTVPTGSPLGKIWSPPLLITLSPGVICSSLITRSRITSPFGVPRSTPCKRDFSSIAPTPLVWSLIINTREVEAYTRSTLPTMPFAVITAMSGATPSFDPLSI